jgi:glycogen operon protein
VHDDRAQRLIRFVKKLTGLRQRYPILHRTRFLTGHYDEELGVKDVSWINANGEEMREEHWQDANVRCFGMLLDGRAQTTGIHRRGEEATLLIIFNPWQDVVKFRLPAANGGGDWKLVADTNHPDSTEEPLFPIGHEYQVTARSLLLFGLEHRQ